MLPGGKLYRNLSLILSVFPRFAGIALVLRFKAKEASRKKEPDGRFSAHMIRIVNTFVTPA